MGELSHLTAGRNRQIDRIRMLEDHRRRRQERRRRRSGRPVA